MKYNEFSQKIELAKDILVKNKRHYKLNSESRIMEFLAKTISIMSDSFKKLHQISLSEIENRHDLVLSVGRIYALQNLAIKKPNDEFRLNRAFKLGLQELLDTEQLYDPLNDIDYWNKNLKIIEGHYILYGMREWDNALHLPFQSILKIQFNDCYYSKIDSDGFDITHPISFEVSRSEQKLSMSLAGLLSKSLINIQHLPNYIIINELDSDKKDNDYVQQFVAKKLQLGNQMPEPKDKVLLHDINDEFVIEFLSENGTRRYLSKKRRYF